MQAVKKILVIEDSRTINAVIVKELRKEGFEVTSTHTLAEAGSVLQASDPFDLIILDLHLPDGEGSELIANIQSLTKTKVVVLTASKSDDLREELFQYGILDYIVKDTNLLYSIAEIIRVIGQIASKTTDRVLVIDDSEFICKQIRTILEPRNYRVTLKQSAAEGLKAVAAEHFDLIILDMELPDLHGEKVLEFIRRDVRYLTVPVIVLSGTATAEIIRNVLKNGANDFLRKPFVYEEFLLRVDLWIDYFKSKRALQEKTHRLQFLNENLERMVFEEVEKNREKEKLMFQQYRQAQMGEMLAMIAHQWRQPLNAISAAAGLINLRMNRGQLDKETTRQITEKITRYLNHLSHTIDDFRDFFKPQKQRRLTDLALIADKALTLCKDAFAAKQIEIKLQIEATEELLCYENEMVQVVLSLLKNAEDALIERGIKEPFISITVNKTQLRLCDNAGGIDKKHIDKIFDPYFSTKARNGTGIGLYMSRMIVEEHCKGKLHVTNNRDGACFAISLPSSEKEDA